MKTSRILLGVAAFLSLGFAGCGGEPKAELVSSEVQPFTNPQGKTFPMAMVNWKNVGGAPARSVHADIEGLDAAGNVVYSAPDYTIYATANDSSGTAAGETYSEPSGEGHIMASETGAPLTSVRVKITRASDKAF